MVLLLFLVFIIAALAIARKSRPAGNKNGRSLIEDNRCINDSQQPELLQVASYNIQTGKSLSGKRNIMASAELIRALHVAGIQEVYAPSLLNLLGLGKPQTQSLADHGGFSYLFAATRRRWLREHRGNAVLSKLPVRDWRITMLPDQSNKSFRNMTVLEVEWRNQRFHFINTHLHTKQGREEQLRIVLEEFAKYPRAILLGDFNTRRSSKLLQNALRDVEIVDAIAAAGLDDDPNRNSSDRIDWILTKGFVVESGTYLEKGISDHPFYQVNLRYSSDN